MLRPPLHFRIVFFAAVVGSGFLVFQAQPLTARQILPGFGGAPAVWSASLLFFQTLLLLGYAYAHASVRYLRIRHQLVVHVGLLAAASVTLPIAVAEGMRPASTTSPVFAVLATLLLTVGLPFLALSSTAPLLQAWHARVYPDRSPYSLYAASNAAALLALATYPFVVEPRLTLGTQVYVWSLLFGLVALTCAAAGLIAARAPDPTAITGNISVAPPPEPSSATSGARRVLWVALPACASALLLATTNQLCLDVAPIPFLWVLPLAIFLVTYVLAFRGEEPYARQFYLFALVVALGAVGLVRYLGSSANVVLQVGAYAFALFVSCMICHGELARLKPHPNRLTAFYFAIALGGAIGGLGVALVAPSLFSGYWELPISLALCVLLVAAVVWHESRGGRSLPLRRALVFAVLLAPALAFAVWPSAPLGGATLLEQSRSFFGVMRVVEREADDPALHQRAFVSGSTLHGMQIVSEPRRPTTFFTPASGIGLLLDSLSASEARLRVGIVGLGVGTLATYGRPGDTYRFYELDPAVETMARTWFSFVEDSPAEVDVVLGDARLSLAGEEPNDYDVFVVDAFASDAIPVHLLTAEAIAEYLRHLAPGGVLAMHISNRHLDLRPVLWRVAERFELTTLLVESPGNGAAAASSHWMLLARDPSALAGSELRRAASDVRPDPGAVPLWTDDYCAVFPLVDVSWAGFM